MEYLETKKSSSLKNSKLNYFLSIHEILFNKNEYNINYFDDNCCKINYLNLMIGINYIYNSNTNSLDLHIEPTQTDIIPYFISNPNMEENSNSNMEENPNMEANSNPNPNPNSNPNPNPNPNMDENSDIISQYVIFTHIKRLLETKKILSIELDENIITEKIFLLTDIFNKYFNYCSICGTELKIKGIQTISCCDNMDCVKLSYQTIMDNKITNTYKQDPQVFLFLLDILLTGLSHPKVDFAY